MLLMAVPAWSVIKGDINGSGIVDVDDMNAAINIILGIKTAVDYPGNADLDSSGIVDVDDVNHIINIILGTEIEKEPITVGDVTFNMVKVTGGTFMMGGTEEQGDDVMDYEKPVHEVTLSDYYIAETEVTQALWQAVMGSNPSYHKGDVNYPVEYVSWQDCQVFVNTLNHMTGYRFRLLTEAEWEYAARGGKRSRGYKYAGSDDLNAVAWYKDNSGSATHTVATKEPNELGIYDMSGNVWEWCQDYLAEYTSEPQTNPTGPAEGEYLVHRGGGRNDNPKYCRVSVRSSFRAKSYKMWNLGLRLAMTDCTKGEPSTGSAISVSDITLISAAVNCSFAGLDDAVDECGVIAKGDNKTLTFQANKVNGEQVVTLTGLRPWTTYQCYAYVKAGKYTYQQEEPITFSTPDLAGTWSCTEIYEKKDPELSTIVLTADGKATFTHVSGYMFMAHTTNSGSWRIKEDGSISISFSDSSGSSWPMYYSKGFSGTFDNLVNPTCITGNFTHIWGSTENHYSYGTFTMTRQP